MHFQESNGFCTIPITGVIDMEHMITKYSRYYLQWHLDVGIISRFKDRNSWSICKPLTLSPKSDLGPSHPTLWLPLGLLTYCCRPYTEQRWTWTLCCQVYAYRGHRCWEPIYSAPPTQWPRCHSHLYCLLWQPITLPHDREPTYWSAVNSPLKGQVVGGLLQRMSLLTSREEVEPSRSRSSCGHWR